MHRSFIFILKIDHRMSLLLCCLNQYRRKDLDLLQPRIAFPSRISRCSIHGLRCSRYSTLPLSHLISELYSSISMLLSRKIGRLQSFIILLDCLFCKFHLLPAIYSYMRQTFARVVTVSLRIFPWRLARLAILSVFLNSSAVNLKDTILDSSSTITIYCNIPCKNQYQYPFLYIRL